MALRNTARNMAAAALLWVAAMPAPVEAQLPRVSAPVPVTSTSRPFLGSADALQPVGYVEEEFFLSGKANVYDWVGSTRKVRVVAGPAPYVTRILVRRPRDPGRFSGNVEVTILNASAGSDAGGPIDPRRMVEQGDVWIGISTKSITAVALKKFDPVRYASLDWSNPAPQAVRCALPAIIPTYMSGGQAAFEAMARARPQSFLPQYEDGLVWDMLGQLGLLLKSDQRDRILPGFGKPFVYMDGISQSAIYLRTWLAGFHDRYRTSDGRPVYDGYLGVVGPALVRINQCAPDVTLDDPRQKLVPPDVPFISLSSEGEMWMGKYTHQPDVVTRRGGIVTYEVAGGSHGSLEVPGVWRGLGPAPERATPAATANDLVWAPLMRGAWHNLQLWVRRGILPPRNPGIQLDAKHEIKRDSYGNALGGVRMPDIEAPLSTHVGSMGSGGLAGITGARKPFAPETVKQLYPTHAAYVAKSAVATDRLLAGRWISADDAAAMKKAAEAAPVPE